MSVENVQSVNDYVPQDFSPSEANAGDNEAGAYQSLYNEAYGIPNSGVEANRSTALAGDGSVALSVAQTEFEPNTEHEGGVIGVAAPILEGAWNELTQHPERVFANAAIGGAMALAIPAAIAAAPVLTVTGLVVAGGFGLWKLAEAIPGWVSNISVAWDPNSHTEAERDKADAGLQSLGAGTLDAAAGFGGMWAAPKLAATSVGIAISEAAAKALSPVLESTANLARPLINNAEGLASAAVQEVKSVAGPLLTDAGNTVMTIGRSAVKGADDLAQHVKTVAGPLVEKVGNFVVSAADRAKTVIGPTMERVAESASQAFGKFADKAIPAVDKLVDKAIPVVDKFVDGVSPHVGRALAKVEPIFNKVMTASEPALARVSETVTHLADKTGKVIGPIIAQGKDWVMTKAPPLVSELADDLRPTFETGRRFTTDVGGAALGITSNADVAMRAARAELGAAWQNIKNFGKIGPMQQAPVLSAEVLRMQNYLKNIPADSWREAAFVVDTLNDVKRA